LFSAVTSAFIIEVDSKLQSDPNDETAALLRVLIYKIDNTTFGNNIPALPQWTGPPLAIVQVQTILFASLVVSLFSAFLAMLGKQWLNRYESNDMKELAVKRSRMGGLAIRRSHNRQRKLDGIIAWYFSHVMELLPLMLQVALLLLGCALSRYLWEIDTTIASVVIAVTSLGVTFYLFIVIAGTVFESCPYQTPVAHLLRYIIDNLRRTLPTLRSALVATTTFISSNYSRLVQVSKCCHAVADWWSAVRRPWYSIINVYYTLRFLVFLLIAPARDAYLLGQAALLSLVSFSKDVYRQLLGRSGAPHLRLIHTSPTQSSDQDRRMIMLDLRCISWILRTSFDETIRLSAFKHLALITKLYHFHSTIVLDCFNIFIGCVSVNPSNNKVEIMPGLDKLATASANGFFRTLHHLATMDPTSRALADVQRRYKEFFPSKLDYAGLPFSSIMTKIHDLAGRFGNPRDIRWRYQRMSIQEHVKYARDLTEDAQEKYQQTQHRKVPRWILRSTLYLLSLGTLAPEAVVADCLTIVAIDLGCDVSNIAISDERYAQM
jgi:hypothetical protein